MNRLLHDSTMQFSNYEKKGYMFQNMLSAPTKYHTSTQFQQSGILAHFNIEIAQCPHMGIISKCTQVQVPF